MNKVLYILMVGMVFGQTKLETRVYHISESDILFSIGNDNYFNLSQITGIYDKNIEISAFFTIQEDDCPLEHNVDFTLRCEGSYAVQFWSSNGEFSDGSAIYCRDINEDWNVGEGIGVNFQTYAYWYCNLESIELWVTAEFPEEDTGYIEEGFDYCIDTGANLVSSPCRDAVYIPNTIPSEIASNLTGVITEGGACSNVNGNWVGSACDIGGGKGYWFISDVEGCFNYTCSEN